MNIFLNWWRSLKTRVTLFSLVIFLVSIWSLALYASNMLHNDTERVLGEQEFSAASIIAYEINDEINERLRALEIISREISPSIMGNSKVLQTFLERHQLFQRYFNTGSFITGIDGIALASTPASLGRRGASYIDRDYVISALKNGKTTVGRPVIGKHQKTPVFSMATPIFENGMVIGALVGVTNLSKPNFLDKVTNTSYGRTGGYLICSSQHKLIVTATDKKRIMQPTPAPGTNPLFDRYAQGFEGYGKDVNSFGEEELTSSKQIPAADWFIITKIPTAEAFAPIHTMQKQVLLTAIFLTFLSGWGIWMMVRHQLSPLISAATFLELQTDTTRLPQKLLINRPDEIGLLFGNFNRLLETLEQRENALRESEERYRSLFARAGDGIIIMSTEGRLIEVNEAVARMHGYTTDEMKGMELANLDSPETARLVPERIKKLLAGEHLTFEAEHYHKDGHIFPLEVSASLIVSQGVSYILSLHRDISERKQAEALLQDNRRRLKDIINFLPDATLAINMEKQIIIWNHAIEKMSGIPAEEMIGKGDYAYTIPFYGVARPQLMDLVFEDQEELAAKYQNIVREGDTLTAEVFCPALYDNRGAWIFVKAAPLHDESGNVIGAIESIRDITVHKKAEEERFLLEQQFHHAQKLESLGVLAGGIAHDFNNILSVILGHCYLASEFFDAEQDFKEAFQKIEAAGNRAAYLCRQMLSYAGKNPIVQTYIDMKQMIDEVVTMLQAAIRKNVAIEIFMNHAGAGIKGDIGQIQQVVMNLIINAADAIGDSNGTVKVILTDETFSADTAKMDIFGTGIRPGSYICLEVTDTGCGMDEQTQKRIFEPFYTTKSTGRGLGMSAISGIIKTHGGSLFLTSKQGVGTTFKVYFPVLEGSRFGEITSDTAEDHMNTGGTILLVEDDLTLCTMGAALLEAFGFTVITAPNGRKAIEIYCERTNEIDLIQLDLIMPEMDGAEAYRKLRRIDSEIPIVICSGYSIESVEDIVGTDANASFIHKPYKPFELRNVILRMIHTV